MNARTSRALAAAGTALGLALCVVAFHYWRSYEALVNMGDDTPPEVASATMEFYGLPGVVGLALSVAGFLMGNRLRNWGPMLQVFGVVIVCVPVVLALAYFVLAGFMSL